MAKTSFIDTFSLCWKAILMESKDCNNSFFSIKHCSEEETRDTNFDIVENRLAYMHKFGTFNVLFVQKCVASFLDKYPEGETLFMKENLKVCSLSNGPGFDLVGLLLGLCEWKQHLKSFPVLKIISLYNSWWNVCKTVFFEVFQASRAHSYGSFDNPDEIIHFIQHDIYSPLSPEVEECVKDSDILMMVKVFASTKATCDVVMKSMQEIFSLLKAGSFVFFVGSKKNTKELTENCVLKKFVSCILGPIKISVKDLPIGEAVVKTIDIKPKDSGSAYFIVWKKESVLQEEIPVLQEEIPVLQEEIPKKKRSRRKKKKSKIQEQLTDMTTVSKEITDDIDEGSDTMLSSCSRHSETSDEFESALHENTSQSISPVAVNLQNTDMEQNLSRDDLLLSVDGITAFLDKIHINSNKGNLTETENIHELGGRKGNNCNLETNIQGEFVKEQVATQSESRCGLYNEIISSKQIVDSEIVLTTVFPEQEAQLVGESNSVMKCVLTHGLNRELVKEKETTAKQDEHDLLKKVICDEASMSNSSSKKSSVNILHEVNDTLKSVTQVNDRLKTVIQNMNSKNLGENDMVNEESVQDTQLHNNLSNCESASDFKKNIQAKEIKIPVVVPDISSPSKVLQVKGRDTTVKQGKDLVLNGVIVDEASTSNSDSRKSSINKLPDAPLSAVTQNMSAKKLVKNNIKVPLSKETPVINDKNKDLNHLLQSFLQKELQAKERDTTAKHGKDLVLKKVISDEASTSNSNSRKSSINKLPEAPLSAVTQNMSAKKLVKNNIKKVPLSKETPVLNDKNKEFHRLLQSCENLVTSLEKLTESLKKSITLNNDQNFRHCVRQPCAKFKVPHYCHSCCINAMHSHCCCKGCNCEMFHNSTYETCRRHQ